MVSLRRVFTLAVLAAFFTGASSSGDVKELSKSDKRWLEQEVAALITEDEARIFKELPSKEDRELFKEIFWARRDTDLMTPLNEAQEEFEKRLKITNRRFRERGRKGSLTDSGKVFLLLGDPGQTDRNNRGMQGSSPAASPESSPVLSSLQQPLDNLVQTMTWTYEPNPDLGIPDGLAVQFETQFGFGFKLTRSEVVDESLERVKNSYVVHPDIGYERDDMGHLRKLPPRLDPRSPAKRALREIMENKVENTDIPFGTEMAFFRSSEGSYIPVLIQIDPDPLTWEKDVSDVTLFGTVETADGHPVRHFEEPVRLTRRKDGRAVLEMPIELQPGNYTFILGVLDHRSSKVGTRRIPVFVPSFHREGLSMSSVLLYNERRQVEDPPGTLGHAFQFGQTQLTPSQGNTFRPTDDLGVLFFIYGYGLDEQGQPNLTSDYVLFKGGEKQRQIGQHSPQANPEQAVASIEIPLDGFEVGSYQVEIQVKDLVKNEVTTDRVEFVLEVESYSLGKYSDLVNSYRKGDFTLAANVVSSVPKESLRLATRSYKKTSPTEEELEAAALLHTEVAIATGRKMPFHLEVAKGYLDSIEDVASRRALMRRWLMAVSYHLRGSPLGWGALPLMKTALKLYPDDLELHMAVASVYEMAGWRSVNGMLEKAERLYRDVLATDPDNVEAHLRRGRVMHLEGNREEALRELKWCLEHTDDPGMELVAHILLGDIYCQLGNYPEAVRSYQSALEIDPRCHAAAMALSHAMHRAGDLAGSRDVIRRFLNQESSSSEPDGWVIYLSGSPKRLDSVLQELREVLAR